MKKQTRSGRQNRLKGKQHHLSEAPHHLKTNAPAATSEQSRQTKFTEESVRRYLLPEEGQVDYFENLKRGLTLALRVSYGGSKAWRVIFYKGGKARSKTLKPHWPKLGVQAARKAADKFDPDAASASAQTGSFKAVAENWIKQYVDKKGLRSKPEIERQLNKYVYPEWATTKFYDIRRHEVSQLLDKIEKNGPSQADAVLATLRGIMNWHQSRDDKYTSPIVKGMKRDQRPLGERARDRILSDQEIRLVWKACETMGTYGALVRILLLTLQREAKVATMRRDDVKDGVWTIRTEAREKGNAGALKLPKVARDIIEAQPEIDGNPFVFPGSLQGRRLKSGKKPTEPPAFNSFSEQKKELDAKLPSNMPPWTLHDLRRTARSLFSHAGVNRDIAERVLGHVIPGVEGVYDRYQYFDEKADALEKLATLLHGIINPPDKTNVVELPARTG